MSIVGSGDEHVLKPYGTVLSTATWRDVYIRFFRTSAGFGFLERSNSAPVQSQSFHILQSGMVCEFIFMRCGGSLIAHQTSGTEVRIEHGISHNDPEFYLARMSVPVATTTTRHKSRASNLKREKVLNKL